MIDLFSKNNGYSCVCKGHSYRFHYCANYRVHFDDPNSTVAIILFCFEYTRRFQSSLVFVATDFRICQYHFSLLAFFDQRESFQIAVG